MLKASPHVYTGQELSGNLNTCKFLEKQSNDSGYFLTGGSDGIVRLWNCPQTQQSPLLLHSFKGGHMLGDILDVHCNPSGLRIASVGVDKAISLWDVSTGSLWGRLHGHEAKVNCCFYHDSTVLLTGSNDGTIRIWDSRSKSNVQVLPRFRDSISGVFTADTLIIGSSIDGTIRTFDVRSKQLQTDEVKIPIGSIAKSKHSNLILASLVHKQASLHLLNFLTGETISKFSGHTNSSLIVSSCFDHEDLRVASGSEDGILRIWDLKTQEVVLSINLEHPILGVSHHPFQPFFVGVGLNGLMKCFSWSFITT